MSMLAQMNKTLAQQLATVMSADNDGLAEEIKRTKAVTDISKQIIDGHRLVLDATKFAVEHEGLDIKIDRSLISIGHDGIREA